MRNNTLAKYRIVFFISILTLVFLGINYYLVVNIKAIQGTARVINYAGIVRGGTQRLIKKELSNMPDDAILGNLDGIVRELRSGTGTNNLTVLPDPAFLASMDEVAAEWNNLKTQIAQVRNGSDKKNLFEDSETYFQLVNRTVSLAESFSQKQVSKSILHLLCINAVFFLCIFLLLLYYSRVNKRIYQVGMLIKDISESEGDLTKRLNMSGNHETGVIVQHFDTTLDRIQNLVLIIKGQSVMLSQIGAKLMEAMIEASSTVTDITGRIKGVITQTSRQSAGINQTNRAVQDIIDHIEGLNSHIETQASAIDDSSQGIEKMFDNIASVTRRLVKNSENVANLAQASDAGRTGLQEVSAHIQEIAKESEGLLEITSVMEGIAGQTNLLSMNAAIEAAHAGETGKGFAVVAEEIRKLAESSGEQSATIAAVLKKIKESIDAIAASTDGVINRFETIDQHVKIVAEAEDQVRIAMEEQGTGSQQILEHIKNLNDITKTIKQDSGDMRNRSREVYNESNNLEQITKEVMTYVNEIAAGADQINATIQAVTTISDENKAHIDVLASEMSKFKVDD
ncbi:MAG: methyl-accepting chemotaxis protein [Treponema sp.]|jgi:methyl-accepting chemotaxis protein|nr:methyl-accepting chemotaxis protein [Treponema sp.]